MFHIFPLGILTVVVSIFLSGCEIINVPVKIELEGNISILPAQEVKVLFDGLVAFRGHTKELGPERFNSYAYNYNVAKLESTLLTPSEDYYLVFSFFSDTNLEYGTQSWQTPKARMTSYTDDIYLDRDITNSFYKNFSVYILENYARREQNKYFYRAFISLPEESKTSNYNGTMFPNFLVKDSINFTINELISEGYIVGIFYDVQSNTVTLDASNLQKALNDAGF